ncbi:MAG: hypothetical protein MI799_23465, partial [Desulfobacterales bacterium]|nr:hypothetical protein [Desulfobacterales bacterium]
TVFHSAGNMLFLQLPVRLSALQHSSSSYNWVALPVSVILGFLRLSLKTYMKVTIKLLSCFVLGGPGC